METRTPKEKVVERVARTTGVRVDDVGGSGQVRTNVAGPK